MLLYELRAGEVIARVGLVAVGRADLWVAVQGLEDGSLGFDGSVIEIAEQGSALPWVLGEDQESLVVWVGVGVRLLKPQRQRSQCVAIGRGDGAAGIEKEVE